MSDEQPKDEVLCSLVETFPLLWLQTFGSYQIQLERDAGT